MNPFYFGTGQRRLFGVYTPSRIAGAAPRAVVLCPPWGHEYLGAHRSLRQLATMLSAAGVHVLRFDYFGTGDSSGDLRDADLKGWRDDIGMAIEELRDTAGSARVGLAGLRFGATLAAAVAAKRPRDVDALALWDPVASGAAYARELEGLAAPSHPEAPAGPNGSEHEISGFPLTGAMAADMAALELAEHAPAIAARTLVVMSVDGQDTAPLRAALDGRTRGKLEIEQILAPPAWLEEVSFRTGAVPVKVLQRIVEHFK